MDKLSKDKKRIEAMFDSIAINYDFLNHFLSLGIDIIWRKKMISEIENHLGLSVKSLNKNRKVLDLACGTGDVTKGLVNKGIHVVGLDLSEKMLEIARIKNPNVPFIKGSAEDLPFENEDFEVVTIGFGIRNFDNRPACLEEIYRVLSPGGMFAVLEFSIPKNPIWKALYSFYFRKILPFVGGLISKNKAAYSYLPLSAYDFPQRGKFIEELIRTGFKDANCRSLLGGVACIYLAYK